MEEALLTSWLQDRKDKDSPFCFIDVTRCFTWLRLVDHQLYQQRHNGRIIPTWSRMNQKQKQMYMSFVRAFIDASEFRAEQAVFNQLGNIERAIWAIVETRKQAQLTTELKA